MMKQIKDKIKLDVLVYSKLYNTIFVFSLVVFSDTHIKMAINKLNANKNK